MDKRCIFFLGIIAMQTVSAMESGIIDNIFQRNAIAYNADSFHEDDEFTILGNIEINGEKIILANNICIWGEAKRATWRFLLFSGDGTFLGMYTGIVFSPVKIEITGQKITFPISKEYGNTIDFSRGIPGEIWIDGYVLPYMKIEYH